MRVTNYLARIVQKRELAKSMMNNPDRKLTPMMNQYWEMKSKFPEHLLLFRMGDFFEIFHQDAVRASQILDITLTKRRNDEPMCGIPHFALEKYLGKLVKAGVKAAICDQTTSVESQNSTKLFQRKVVRLLTPGTVFENELLDPNRNNFLMCIGEYEGYYGLAMTDLSTGSLNTLALGSEPNKISAALQRYEASELLIPYRLGSLDCIHGDEEMLVCPSLGNCVVTVYPDQFADPLRTGHVELSLESDENSDSRDILDYDSTNPESALAIAAAVNAISSYLQYTQCSKTRVPLSLKGGSIDSCTVYVDPPALKSLEILKSVSGRYRGSLLSVVNRCLTPMGSRLLRERLATPSMHLDVIESRLSGVEMFLRDIDARTRLRLVLGQCGDIERSVQRIVLNRGAPEDLVCILESIHEVQKIIADFEESQFSSTKSEVIDALCHMKHANNTIRDMVEELISAVEISFLEGSGSPGSIRSNYNTTLDDLRTATTDQRLYINEQQAKMREATGINTLRVTHTRGMGYLLSVPSKQVTNVPDSFVLYQELKNVRRYKNQDILHIESKLARASSEIESIEDEVYKHLYTLVKNHTAELFRIANAIGVLDVNSAFATLAFEQHLIRPKIVHDHVLEISEGRHLVVESLQERSSGKSFVPNSTTLRGVTNEDTNHESSLWLITGPNMGGKSTFLRQNAHIVILAQSGCFVPVRDATIGIVDKIFCRVGAGDELVEDRSTFMVEMEETANILNKMTPKSFVIVDEVGRGTSVAEGRAIAQAVLEDLVQTGARTLFATHFHELTDLEATLDIQCHSMKSTIMDNAISYMYRLERGKSKHSHALYVAKLANIPDRVLKRTSELLRNTEIECI